MKQIIALLAGVAITGLIFLLLPYLLVAGIAALLMIRLLWRRPRNEKFNGAGKRYQQAYARHWQTMNNWERETFLNRYAPEY